MAKQDLKELTKQSMNKQINARNQDVKSLQEVNNPREYLVQIFEKSRKQFENLVQSKDDVNRILRVAITYMNKNPKLWECTPQSVLGCLFESTQLGLEIGVLGQGDMIARKNNKAVPPRMEANFQPGYQGLLLLAQRTGTIASIMSEVVYKGDNFSYQYGTDAFLKHTPSFEPKEKRGRYCAYAYAKTKDGGFYFVVLSMEDLERIRRYSQAPDSPAWKNETDWMYRKTALRQLSKMLPKETSKDAIKFWRATMLDDAASKGLNQGLDIDKVGDDGFIELDEKRIYDDSAAAIEDANYTEQLPANVIYEPDQNEVNDPKWYIEKIESFESIDDLNNFMKVNKSNISCLDEKHQLFIDTVKNTIKLSLEGRSKK